MEKKNIKHLYQSPMHEDFELVTSEVLKSSTVLTTFILHSHMLHSQYHARTPIYLRSNLFCHLKHLRTLHLHQLNITHLRCSIGHIESLCYCFRDFYKVIKKIDSLHLSETLKLKGCMELCELP